MKRFSGMLATLILLAAVVGTGAGAASAAGSGSDTGKVNVPEPLRAAGRQPFSKIHYIDNKVWNGEFLFGKQNDWEPDVAADPSAPYVYVVTTRFGARNAACPPAPALDEGCPVPATVYRVSPDNGVTWGPPKYLCTCEGVVNWQYDPQLEVANDGTVFGLILQGGEGKWQEVLVKSTDHGQTFGPPVNSIPGLGWGDHGFLTISPDGQDVYVAFNRAKSLVVASHDGGVTWGTPVQTNPASEHHKRYYFHYKGAVAADGTVNIAASAGSYNHYSKRGVRFYDLRSTDGGVTWQQIPLDSFKASPQCADSLCRSDHLAGLTNLSANASGNLVAAYAGTRHKAKGQQIWVSRSADGGATWTPSQLVSPMKARGRRVVAAFPTIIGGPAGNFRMWWMDDRNGPTSWNVWYSESNDGGLTWAPEIQISDAISGTGYKSKRGFVADYGDYGGIALMSNGKTVAAWGEALNENWGPGGTWINVQP